MGRGAAVHRREPGPADPGPSGGRPAGADPAVAEADPVPGHLRNGARRRAGSTAPGGRSILRSRQRSRLPRPQLSSTWATATRSMPPVRKLPARNRGFTGRDDLLVTVRERLLAGDLAVVQALHGMGGVGKTQLAIEYAHRFADSYDLIWWIDSEQALLIGDQFTALGLALSCVPAGVSAEAARTAVLSDLRQRPGWLLIFDNAGQPGNIAGWL